MEPHDRLVMLQGLRFHYREWGRPDAPPLVLLHGFGAHARLWDTFARAVAGDCHIFALDQRGHGETAWVLPMDAVDNSYLAWLLGNQHSRVRNATRSLGRSERCPSLQCVTAVPG